MIPASARGTALREWRCINPDCPAVQRGLPRLLFTANLTPGCIVERKCDRCHAVTRIEVEPRGIRYLQV